MGLAPPSSTISTSAWEPSVVLKEDPDSVMVSGVPEMFLTCVSYNKGVVGSFVMDLRLRIEMQGPKNPYQNVVCGDVRKDDAEEADDFVSGAI